MEYAFIETKEKRDPVIFLPALRAFAEAAARVLEKDISTDQIKSSVPDFKRTVFEAADAGFIILYDPHGGNDWDFVAQGASEDITEFLTNMPASIEFRSEHGENLILRRQHRDVAYAGDYRIVRPQ